MDIESIMRLAAALGAVLVLIALAAWGVRRLGLIPVLAAKKGTRRIAIVDRLVIDARRSLLIIRRDGREHLVILGPSGETVVETGIEAILSEPTAQGAVS